jgi:P27 family predicted phage terminase small subunit
MKGRTPKPTQLKRLAGTLRKNRQNLDEPMPEAGTPEAPADLDARARAAWDYYAPILSGCRLLTLADREMLACFCAAAGRRSQAEEELAKSGPVVKSPSGYPIQNPWLSIANKSLEQLLRFGQELGLSPASRTRVKSLPAAQGTTGRKRFFKTVG